jgi:3-isopropylmalate/(R)-2-methylmalate dehydratase small subunit
VSETAAGRSGRARRLGDNVTTDDVIAGKYKHQSIEVAELAEHVMENVDPGFRHRLRAGDFIVAGANFGCGSSREQAPQILAHLGVSAVVARSFARIFFRNAINIGLLVLTCDTNAIEEDDALTYRAGEGVLEVPDRGLVLPVAPLAPEVRAIVDAGGLLAYVRNAGGL